MPRWHRPFTLWHTSLTMPRRPFRPLTLLHSFLSAGAHAASALTYAGGGNWADGTTNPATTVEGELDKIVSELMIYVNSEWGGMLAARDVPAIYRVQGAGRVRMSTVPAAHEALGVAQYAWASSPLRRYVDLVNQWLLLSVVYDEPSPFAARETELHAIQRDFESASSVYDEFQRAMERYFALLDEAAIMPYYFYLCDMIPGSEHWRLAVWQAQELQHAIMGYLPGFATPRLVCDVP